MTPRTLDREAAGRLFFVSGAASVLYEVLWVRIFTSVLGSTTESASAVVTAFLLGAAIGGGRIGRWVDRHPRPLALYGRLEFLAAIFATLGFAFFFVAQGGGAVLARSLPPAVLKVSLFVVAFAFVAAPAALGAGALPTMVRAVARHESEVGRAVGSLYAVHTLGAAFGAIASALLVKSIGYFGAYAVAVALGSLAGLVATWLGRSVRGEEPPAVAAADDGEPDAEAHRALLVSIAVSGFCALGFEVLWFRIAGLVFRGTLVSFGTVLAVYLLGLSIGSALLAPRFAGRELRGWAVLQIALAMATAFALPSLVWLAEANAGRGVRILGLVGVLLVVTVLYGGAFPLAVRAYANSLQGLGRRVGRVYMVNTAGSSIGAIVVGFVAVPRLGTHHSMALVAALHGVAFVLATRRKPRAGLVAIATTAVIAALAARDFTRRALQTLAVAPGSHVVAYAESALQPLAIARDPHGSRELYGGPFVSGSSDPLRRQTQLAQAHIAMLAHPDPRHVLEIGYGVGEIARTVARYTPRRLDLVEIDPRMIPLANAWFSDLSEGVVSRPFVHVSIADGRQYLFATEQSYDVILSDTMILQSEASFRLYTAEHFRAARARLAPGGMLLVWLPLNIGERPARTVLRTFVDVFPETLVWLPDIYHRAEAFLLGYRDRASLDVASMQERFDRVAREDLAQLGWSRLAEVLAAFHATPARARAIAAGASTTNRDMRPVLDFMEDAPDLRLSPEIAAGDPLDVLALASPLRAADGLRESVATIAAADREYRTGCHRLLDRAIDVTTREAAMASCRRSLAIDPDHAATRRALAIAGSR